MRRCPKARLRRENIEMLLMKTNRSQNWLACKLMISSWYLSQWMSGQRYPSPKMRHRIMCLLKGYKWDYLFEIVKESL